MIIPTHFYLYNKKTGRKKKGNLIKCYKVIISDKTDGSNKPPSEK